MTFSHINKNEIFSSYFRNLLLLYFFLNTHCSVSSVLWSLLGLPLSAISAFPLYFSSISKDSSCLFITSFTYQSFSDISSYCFLHPISYMLICYSFLLFFFFDIARFDARKSDPYFETHSKNCGCITGEVGKPKHISSTLWMISSWLIFHPSFATIQNDNKHSRVVET